METVNSSAVTKRSLLLFTCFLLAGCIHPAASSSTPSPSLLQSDTPHPTTMVNPVLQPTPNMLGLVVITQELAAEPDLDPLNFKTTDGTNWNYGFFLKGEHFPDHSFFQNMHFSIWADLNGAHLVATENYTGPENGFVTLTSNGREIYQIPTGHGSPIEALRGLWTYADHWVLETAFVTEIIENNIANVDARGQIVEDGQSLNDIHGYDESFGFQTILGKPFYFFKKDDGIQAWYDGQVIPLGYETIPHYGCCSSGELNPYSYTDRVAFFGKRSNTWYFVQIGGASSFTR